MTTSMTEPRYGRHRKLGPLQKLLAVSGGVILVLAALAAGRAILEFRADANDMHRPYLRSGATGQTVDLRTFDLQVLGARYASVLRDSGVIHETTGVWVIVKVRITAHTEPISVGYAALHDRNDRTYFATDRVRQSLVGGVREYQPGVPVEGEVVFEVPKEVLSGMTVRFTEHQFDNRMEVMSDIALPGADRPSIEPTPSPIAKPVVKP
jgi:hypothetical protein